MDQSANLATMRLAGQFAFAYLSVYKPDPVAQFTLTSTPANGATALAVSYTVGSQTNTRPGFYIRFYDGSTGAFKGDTRVRNSGSRSSSNLPCRELPYGHAKVSSGDVGKVYPYVPLDTKLVDATAQFNPDGEPYSDEGLHPPPCVNFGSHCAGWADPATGYMLVTGKGSRSFLVDPTSATPVAHFSSGSAGIAFHSGSANTDANPVFEVSPGQQWVEHVGSDSDNGRSESNFLAYMVHDPDVNPPYEVFLPTPPTGDPVNGWSFVVELISNADIESIWDGALCVLWVDEYITGTKQSFRGNNDDRSHILGIGYARRDTSTGNAQDGDRITFEIQSPISRLAEIASYSNVKQEATLPGDWSGVNTLGVLREIISLKQNYTFIQEAGFDFLVHSLYSDARYPAFYIQRSDVVSQIREGAEGRKCRFVNKWRGAAFEIQPHPAYLSMSDRDLVTINSILTEDDAFAYSVTREHQDSLEIYELQGITAGASGNASVYSRFPSLSPGGGKQYTTQGKYIPDSQTSQNADAAMMGAFVQQIFIDTNHSNRKHRVGEMTLDLPGAYGYFDFDLEYMKFNYSGDLRGVDYNNFRCWLKRFQTTVDENTGEWAYQAVFQQETGASSDGAKTFNPIDPSTTPIPTPSVPSFPPITLPTPFAGGIPRGVLDLALFCVNGLLLTGNFNAVSASGGPTYQYSAWASLSVSGTVLGWCPRGGTDSEGWLITSTKLYYFSIPALTATDITPAGWGTSSKRSIDAAFPTSGMHMAVSCYYDGVGITVFDTQDNSSFTATVLSTNHAASDSSFGIYPGCFVSTRTPGKVLTSRYTNNGSIFTPGSATSEGRASSDFSASFGALSLHNSTLLAQHIHVPWNDNPAESIFYYGAFVGVAGADGGRLYRGATDVTPVVGGNHLMPRSRDAMSTPVSNRQRMIGVLQAGATSDYAVMLSNNAGDASPTWYTLDGLGTNHRRFVWFGDDGNSGIAFGTTNISVATISGSSATFDGRTGNLTGFTPGEILAAAGY